MRADDRAALATGGLDDDFEAPPRAAVSEAGTPELRLGGWEGPLDLLLELARRQKVDLHRISVLALAEQYLAFVAEAGRMRLELAADYLVMAAWLAFLKSRLLLPEPAKGEEPNAGDLATALALRLRRLEAIRHAAVRLADRDRLGRDVFARGAPESAEDRARPQWHATIYDLLEAYARQRQRTLRATVRVHKREVWSLAEAREALERLVGSEAQWMPLATYLAPYLTPAMRATVLASSFSAVLEMARQGRVALRQDETFAPLWIRSVPTGLGTAA